MSDDDWWNEFPRRHVSLTPRLLPLTAFVERTGVEEVIVASSIFDHAARKHSIAIAAAAAARVRAG